MNFYPFHIGDYWSHTSHLSDAEDLAYRRMIDLYFQTEQPFCDVALLARRVRSTPEIVELILREFFLDWPDGWHHKRCDEEIAKYRAMSEGGKKGAEKRWGEHRARMAQESPPDSPPIHPPMQTKNQEPITKNHIKPLGAKRACQLPEDFAPSNAHAELAHSLGVVVIKEFEQFRDHHKAKGSTMKDWDAALRTWIRNSARFSKGKPQAKGMLWTGIDKQDYTKGVNEDGSF